ncbi:hypothetical protein ACR777_05320 [Sphingobacterium spiritivorum]|uniref:hypothetical protein n=1 Tax=Sphingobacterium spiritivorum TaxID=258 RepID=UPI003DA3622A
MMKISFNINRLIEQYKTELLRKPRHLAWLQSVAKPLQTLYGYFLSFRIDKLYEATITGEKNRLEKALQDRYVNPDIYIIHQLDYLDTAWIWLKDEPVNHAWDFLKDEANPNQEYDYLRDEYDPEFDFIVRVPVVLGDKVPDLRAWIKRYVMAGKKYKIELY